MSLTAFFSLTLLLLVVAMGTALAWWLVRSAGKAQALPDSKMLQAEASRIRSHRIMARLFREERPNRLRRQIMRQCLGELRHDFWRLWTLARLLAPYSRDPEFGVTLCAQLFVFHCLWGPLFVRTYVWGLDKGVAQFMSLVDGVEHMRKAAQSGVEGAEQLALDGLGA